MHLGSDVERHTRHRLEESDEDDRLFSAILADLAQGRTEDARVGRSRADEPPPAALVAKDAPGKSRPIGCTNDDDNRFVTDTAV